MALNFNTIEIVTFNETALETRGGNLGWGSNWVYASGGLQHDMFLIARKFDQGYTPAASGNADLGASGTPFRHVYANDLVLGDADASGGFYMFGNQDSGEKLVYRIGVDSGALRVDRVNEVGATPDST